MTTTENTSHFVEVTEMSGDDVSQEQVERMCQRYYWAGEYCKNKDVLEAACGAGQGLEYLSKISKSIIGGDYSSEVLEQAKKTYQNSINLKQFDAQDIPLDDNSIDILILFEALYYIPDAKKFVLECKRVLRNGGQVLIATANKDLFDFNPSPHTYKYFGVLELDQLFETEGFECNFFGGTPVSEVSWKQKILRPIKKLVVRFNLMPKTMAGKKLMKRLVFGNLVPLPSKITDKTSIFVKPVAISKNVPDHKHKVIYCVAELKK